MRQSLQNICKHAVSWLQTPVTRGDKLALIAVMHASGEKLKRKVDSCVPFVLWIGLRIAVRSAPVKNFVEGLCSRSAEAIRVLAQRTLDRLVFPSVGCLFDCGVAVLSAAARIRSRTILAFRTPRSALGVVPAHASFHLKGPRKPALRALEGAFWIAAAATLAYAYASAALHQNHQRAALKALQAKAVPLLFSRRRTSAAEAGPPINGKVLGVLDIPRIGLSSVVEQGVDSAVLQDSIGHIPGTALPGQDGNAALAAHRDTYFRHLSELRSGDEIIFHSVSATYTYTVRSTSIVQPTDTTVLDGGKQPTLTLVTGFPFYYVGSAPKRFVLVATQNGVAHVASLQ